MQTISLDNSQLDLNDTISKLLSLENNSIDLYQLCSKVWSAFLKTLGVTVSKSDEQMPLKES